METELYIAKATLLVKKEKEVNLNTVWTSEILLLSLQKSSRPQIQALRTRLEAVQYELSERDELISVQQEEIARLKHELRTIQEERKEAELL